MSDEEYSMGPFYEINEISEKDVVTDQRLKLIKKYEKYVEDENYNLKYKHLHTIVDNVLYDTILKKTDTELNTISFGSIRGYYTFGLDEELQKKIDGEIIQLINQTLII